MRKHVVIFSALYMPHLGGVEKYSQSLAAELSKDYDVTVFCMNTERQPSYKEEGCVCVYFLPCIPMLKGRFPLPKLAAFPVIRKVFREHPFDFGIVQCRFYLLSLWACLFLKRKGVPFIQNEHGAGDIRMENPLVDRAWHIYDRLLTILEKPCGQTFYGVSEASLRWLKHYGIEGKGVLSNSIAPEDFHAAQEDPFRWRRSHGISDDKTLICFTGRIMPEKGILDLLNAFDGVERENVLLVAAGDGDLSIVEPWRKRENILFPGHVDFAEIPFLLSGSQIFCLPSRFIEGKPTVVIEAGACGVPVIATNSGGTPEVVVDGECGILVEAGDVEAIRTALRKLIDDPTLRKQYGEALKARVMERFTWKTVARTLRDLIEKD